MVTGRGRGNGMVRVHAARRQDAGHIRLHLREHLRHVGEPGHVILFAEGPGPGGVDVAHAGEARAVDLAAAEQFGVPFRDASASDQKESQGHEGCPVAKRPSAASIAQVRAIPSSSGMDGDQPSALSLPISSSLRGVPSGFE